MADALDSGSSAARLPGSSPGFRILIILALPIEKMNLSHAKAQRRKGRKKENSNFGFSDSDLARPILDESKVLSA